MMSRTMNTLQAVGLVLTVVGLPTAWADSPITSSGFWQNYDDVPEVANAAEVKTLTPQLAEYLSDPLNAVDVQAAVINALGWEDPMELPKYKTFLAHKYNRPFAQISLSKLNDSEVFALGYFAAQDDYFHPKNALPYLVEAKKRRPSNFSVAMIFALNNAQIGFDDNWCEVFQTVNSVLQNNQLTQDRMRPAAVSSIMDYMNSYRDYCFNEN